MEKINRNDTEAISAYLDGHLNPRERERLETRLQREPALQRELNALDRTRKLLRAAPHYRPPRNFTLTPEMAGIPESQPGILFGLTRLAFTLTTILFLVALVGNFTFPGLGGSQPEEATAFTTEADSAMAPLEEADGSAADSGLADEGDSTRSQPPEVLEMEAMESMESGENPEEIQALAPPTEESLSVAAEEAPAEDPVAEGTLTAPLEEGAPAESAPAMEPFEEPEIAALPAGADQDVPAAEPDRINPWSIFTVLTGTAALLSGALTLALRRR